MKVYLSQGRVTEVSFQWRYGCCIEVEKGYTVFAWFPSLVESLTNKAGISSLALRSWEGKWLFPVRRFMQKSTRAAVELMPVSCKSGKLLALLGAGYGPSTPLNIGLFGLDTSGNFF